MRLPLVVVSALAVAAIFIGSGHSASAQTKNGHSASAHNQTRASQSINKQPNNVVVQPGDTLSSIATDHKTTYARLYDANTEISDPDLIYPSQKIRIPDPKEQLAERTLPANAPVEPAASAPALPSQTAATTGRSAVSAPAAIAPVVQSAPVAGCGDNTYANYIYSHESGCRTTAMSPNGCYGIGQACPASKIASCGADYACQNAFFTAYAGKYGGWAGAYAFWTSHGWW